LSVGEWAVPEEQLGTRAASGILWLAAAKWVVRVSGFATLAVLTRLVSPADFGVVAAAMTVIPMVYLLSDLGFTTYLLQTDEVDQESLSTAFWASVAAGALLSAALVLVAPLLADAFTIPELVPILRALVLAVVPTVLAGVPLALLKRTMAFRAVALQSLVAAVLAQVVAVVVALAGDSVGALVAQVVVTQSVIAVLAWRYARWLPSLLLSPRLFWRMAAFGLRVSAVDLVATGRMLAESWIVVVALGPVQMGFLNIAQRLVQVAQELTAASLIPVATVVFAKIRAAADRLRGTYVKALGVSYAVVSPLMTLIVVAAPLLIPALFGARWQPSVVPTQALAIAGIIVLGAMLDHGLFYGLGRPGAWLGYAVVVDAATVGTTAVAVRWGLAGVAVGFVIVAFLATIARWVLVGRLLGLAVPAVARPFGTILVPTAVTMLLSTLMVDTLSPARSVVGLVLVATVTLLVNLVLLRLLAARILTDALRILPVPERHANRVGRLLRLDTTRTAGRNDRGRDERRP
jgi:O-antigen/teichoic acid export membrane protein